MALSFKEYCSTDQLRQLICTIRCQEECDYSDCITALQNISNCMTVDLIGPSQIIVAADDHGNTDLFLAEVERVISSLPFRAAIEETRFGCLEPTPLNKTVLSRRFSVAHPDLRGGVTGDEEIIYLECGTVFGSGHHPSTRLAVMALEEVFGGNLSSAEVLDVGCGSGILSFICSRLGAKRVLGIDISANAIEIAEKNRAHTCSGEQVRFSCDPVSQVFGVFDLIVANISPSILQVLIDSFAQVLAVHGKVVLAGLHTGQVNGIVRQMMMISCELQKSYGEGSWRALSFQRTGD